MEDSDVSKLLNSVIMAVTDISNVFLYKYLIERNSKIANFYFNNTDIKFEELER